ncbi:Lrp/AsnC family transcriptional regulator [Anaerosporobacter faecicola]|uniref:Lrp/AsnC family transcriptional regulator n=1 Tax=Anaerosporobacter faecicola TaxID=2718714 RepID=UPI001438C08B|nr:AsnC family transcriptional regulator [Anaerosporobacter faecicola]
MKQYGERQLDSVDYQILQLLKKDAKMSMNQIGEEVHMTGQAVSKRIAFLQKNNIIQRYTIHINEQIYGDYTISFIRVYMKSTEHIKFRKLLQDKEEVLEIHRISGEGCYLLKVRTYDQQTLATLLDEILQYGNYQISQSIEQVKEV